MDKSPLAPRTRGLRELSILFVLWKILLLCATGASPGVGYDTSTRILFDRYRSEGANPTRTEAVVEHVVLRLTRWDGIYFAVNAEQGHVHEQNWAFSWLLARAVDYVAAATPSAFPASPIVKTALCYILVSHIAHYVSVVLLYQLALQLGPTRPRIAFTAAALHILSPAGVFLSAPSGESAFAFFNFLGTLAYVLAAKARARLGHGSLAEIGYTLAAGLSIGIASMIRSNGLLSGILFAIDALEGLANTMPWRTLEMRKLTSIAATGVAGLLVAVGYATPQAVAYAEYCGRGIDRPWCDQFPPSVYTFVQAHYWGVGFLRYWTLSNLPLFLLAVPMLGILLGTGFLAVRDFVNVRRSSGSGVESKQTVGILARLAAPQLILALLAMTTFHVQIINRISSGYPLWYITLAGWVHHSHEDPRTKAATSANSRLRTTKSISGSRSTAYLAWIVRGMITYAVVQGGLYACFLPPA